MRHQLLAAAVVAATWLSALPAGAVTLVLDYSYDTQNFFNTQAKRDILQQAADTLASRLGDDLLAITPGPGPGFPNTWDANFFHPGTGALQTITDLAVPADTLIVYAGGRNLGTSTLGSGGFGGWGASGTQLFLDTISTRGEGVTQGASATEFAPWGGAITFTNNAGINWNFSASAPTTGQTDFLSVALHELGHLLGLGTADSWDHYVSGSSFHGPASMAEYDLGGPVPLAPGNSHWANGVMDGGKEAALDPSLTQGTRKLFTALDYAGLADVGWTLLAPPPLTGDVNGDGVVDIFDVAFVSSNWGGVGPAGDANNDGAVDIFDVAVISNNWGASNNAAPVPEPHAALLAAIAAMAFVAVVRRRRP